jgi:hypothetical protein
MRKSQRGVTFIGWVVLLIPVAMLVYVGIRLTPVYLNYYRVVHALEALAADVGGDAQLSPTSARQSLYKRFDVGYIDHPDAKDVDIHRDGDHWVAVADYEDVVPLFANVSMLVQFNKQVTLQ